ncbi:MAG: class I SAM-dependent methyltransferase [Gemmatimonadaceae bacterium]
MEIHKLQKQWEKFGKDDPMRAVITDLAEGDHSWDPADFFQTGRDDIDRVMQMLAARGIAFERGRALDFGCGVGRLTQALARHFDEAVGVDISEPMLAAASLHNASPGRVRFIKNVATDLSVFPDRSFDFIFTHIVLQHLEPRLALGYVTEFLRVAKPGGLVVFQIPTRRIRRHLRYAVIRRLPWVARAYRRLRWGLALPALEMHVVPHETIAGLVREHGGEILTVEPDGAAGANFGSSVYVIRKI